MTILLRSVGEQEQSASGGPVLGRHEVVQHWVDGGTEVAEHHGAYIEVLTHFGLMIVIHLSKQVSTNVVGQPADDKT